MLSYPTGSCNGGPTCGGSSSISSTVPENPLCTVGEPVLVTNLNTALANSSMIRQDSARESLTRQKEGAAGHSHISLYLKQTTVAPKHTQAPHLVWRRRTSQLSQLHKPLLPEAAATMTLTDQRLLSPCTLFSTG